MASVHRPAGALVVGREVELAQLRDFVVRACSVGDRMVMSGAPGIGKSALVSEVARWGEEQGVGLLVATGVEAESDVSYAGLHQLLAPVQDQFRVLTDSQQAALNVCLGLAEGAPPNRGAVSAATIALLAAMSKEGPMLVLADDAHWLDRSTAAVLATAIAALSGTRIGFLSSVREGEWVLFGHRAMPHLHVGPLGREAALQLLGRRPGRLSEVAQEHVLALASGNPLALLHLPLGSRPQEPVLAVDRLGEPLRNLFSPRIESLPGSTRRFLLLAALDASGDLDLLLAAADGRVTHGDARRAVRASLVSVDLHKQSLEFVHPLVRSTVIRLATPAQQRAAHQVLGGSDRHPVRRVGHLADAVVGCDETVAHLLEESAHLLLRRGDPHAAVATLLRAAEISEIPGERHRRIAEAAYLGADVAGNLNGVAELLGRARESTVVEPPLEAAVVAAYLLLIGEGDLDTAHRMLVAAIDVTRGRHDVKERTLVEALFTLMTVCFFAGRAELWESFRSAFDTHRDAAPTSLRLCAQTFASPATDGANALPELRQALADLDSADLNQVVLLGRAAFYVDELSACVPALWRVVEEGERTGAMTPTLSAWPLLAFHEYLAGRWDEAEAFARKAVALSVDAGYELLAWPSRYGLALISAARGDHSAARSLTDEMLRWAQPRRMRAVMAYAHHASAISALGRREFAEAYRHAAAVSTPGVVDPSLAHALWLTMDLVEAAVHCGHEAEARRHVEAMQKLELGLLSSRHALILAACQAMVADQDAPELFERAVALPEAERWPFELARTQLAYGERLHRLRRHTDAREPLTAAAELFTLLKASPWQRRVDSELEACRRGRVQRHDARSDVLTAREQEVAELAASGWSNPQIAQRLGASPRTVSTHLSHALHKLGLTSRAGLRDALAAVDAASDARQPSQGT